MSTHDITFRVEIDDERMARMRADLDRRGKLDLWPGTPDEWDDVDALTDFYRNGIARSAEVIGYTAVLSPEEEAAQAAQAARMRDPSYVPTVDEALKDPAGFVAGMTEVDDSGPIHARIAGGPPPEAA